MNEVRIEQGKPVTNVSLHQIAEPAIVHSDKPSLRPVPGHRQAFVIAFVTNIVERWLVEISHASAFARSILSMPGLRHLTKAV